jgi:DNA-binding transcriptional LysR family regulator
MPNLPDLEGLAIFAKVVDMRSFAGAATELNLSKATVSKAVTRLETRLGTRLFNRTSRRLALTDAGRQLSARAAHILAEAEAAEDDARAQSSTPRGLVRLAVPTTYPEVTIELHLSDAIVDLIGDGYDAAIRIGALPDSSLVARRLCDSQRYLVGSPAYLKEHGRPNHPLQLADHACLGYTYAIGPETWRFTTKDGKSASVRPSGPLRVNNGDAMMPALIAGIGVGVLPEFIVREALADGRLQRLLPEWTLASGAVYWLTPPGGPRPKRVDILRDFLMSKLSSPESRQRPRRSK